jgi:uncharacterized protein YbjT (DUF2867 family)
MDTTTPPNRVLVIGASGALGRPTIRLLLDSGVAVRGICRHPEAAADLAAAGAEIVAGDLTDRASIERALSGAKRVLVAAHGLLGCGRWRSEAVDDAGHRALIDAARAAGVERFVYTSALMASPAHPIDFARTKHTIEKTLASSGLTYAILRPSAFMEHHVHMFNGLNVLKKGKAQLVGRGTKKRNFVAASDVALLAVRALMDDPLPFTRLDIGGPDHATNAEVAALYARAAGKPLKLSHLPAGVARAISVLVRPLHPGMARLMHMLSLPDDAFDETWPGAAELEARFGVRLTRLEDFVAARARDHASAVG